MLQALNSPSFSYSPGRSISVNPFLVILNAEIKFRRYNKIQPTPPALHPDVIELMTLLLCCTGNLRFDQIRQSLQNRRRNLTRTFRPQPGDLAESDTEMDSPTSGEDGHGPTLRAQRQGQRRQFRFPEDADLEARIEMGGALMDGHDLEYTSDDEDFLSELYAGNTVRQLISTH